MVLHTFGSCYRSKGHCDDSSWWFTLWPLWLHGPRGMPSIYIDEHVSVTARVESGMLVSHKKGLTPFGGQSQGA